MFNRTMFAIFCIVWFVIPSRADEPPKNKPIDPKKSAQTDQHGDVLPESALARIGTLRFRMSAKAYSLAYSSSGRYLAV